MRAEDEHVGGVGRGCETHEKLLAVRPGTGENATVELSRTLRETSLRAGYPQGLSREDVIELASQSVNGMTFGHGQFWVTGRAVTWSSLPLMSPVVSYSPSCAMRRS